MSHPYKTQPLLLQSCNIKEKNLSWWHLLELKVQGYIACQCFKTSNCSASKHRPRQGDRGNFCVFTTMNIFQLQWALLRCSEKACSNWKYLSTTLARCSFCMLTNLAYIAHWTSLFGCRKKGWWWLSLCAFLTGRHLSVSTSKAISTYWIEEKHL